MTKIYLVLLRAQWLLARNNCLRCNAVHPFYQTRLNVAKSLHILRTNIHFARGRQQCYAFRLLLLESLECSPRDSLDKIFGSGKLYAAAAIVGENV